MLKVKVTQIGNSLGVILPKEALARLKVEKGDTLTVIETPNGVELSTVDERFDAAMKAYDRTARRYRHALRELAK
jgi:putative addiction module antidote